MSFNLDLGKQVQEVTFSRKLKKACHPSLRCNNSIIGLLQKLQNILPSPALFALFINLSLDPNWTITMLFNQAHNLSFHQKLESI